MNFTPTNSTSARDATAPAQASSPLARGGGSGTTRACDATAPAQAQFAPRRRTHRIVATLPSASAEPPDRTDEAGQTTAEYALLTGAIALLVAAVTAWATSTGKIGRLLDAVFNYLTRAIS